MPSTRNLFLVGGFVRLRADEVLSITGKYPKGAGGGQRVHGTWPPPDPPLLSYSAPLASQGRAQRGSHPFLGGPLSPSAQLIPPPAFGHRFILGVVARVRGCMVNLVRYVIAAFDAAGFPLLHILARYCPLAAAFRESARGAFLRKAASRIPCALLFGVDDVQ